MHVILVVFVEVVSNKQQHLEGGYCIVDHGDPILCGIREGGTSALYSLLTMVLPGIQTYRTRLELAESQRLEDGPPANVVIARGEGILPSTRG